MKTIAKLTDREILGLEGISTRPPRYTARAIVQNKTGKYLQARDVAALRFFAKSVNF